MNAQCREFIEAEKQADRNVARACELLEVSRSAFYVSLDRQPSRRELDDAELTVMIKVLFEQSRRTYGSPRIHDDLADVGVHVGRKRVARLMAAAGLVGVSSALEADHHRWR